MATELSESQTQFVQQCRVGRLATVDSSGEAFIVPICYAFDGEQFFTPIDEKPKRRDHPLKRVRNILETGRASVVIDHYDDDDWSQLAWLMARGAAWVIEPGQEGHLDAVALLRSRYVQYESMGLERAQIIALRPDRVSTWGIREGVGG